MTQGALDCGMAATVYENVPIETRIDQLVETEAVGWAVLLSSPDGLVGPAVWFSTSLGNDGIKMGPRSELASKGSLHLSMNEDKLVVMKIFPRALNSTVPV